MKFPAIKIVLYALIFGFLLSNNASAQQTNINGPAGSVRFGQRVIALPNGNIVVTDPNYSIPGGAANVGAVYLYNGSTGALISTLTGSTEDDFVGANNSSGDPSIMVLTNSNFVISSPDWDGAAQDAGAVTFGDGATGVSGVVSSANSLVGQKVNDRVGSGRVFALTNGNYIAASPDWDNNSTQNVGAATFGNGTTGITGFISASNSLIGSTANDQVGSNAASISLGIFPLTNGNYVVVSSGWDGSAADVGAVTLGDGTTGTTGIVSPSNSLIGSTGFDRVGSGGIRALPNGNYVVNSNNWRGSGLSRTGAVTFGNGTTGITGVVSASNSLVGSAIGNEVGFGISVLPNGNYLVISPFWDDAAQNVGAITFGSGTSGVSGVVSSANSLVGSTANDLLGYRNTIVQVKILSNSNYIVGSPNWDGTAANVGAVTFGSGTSGVSGIVSSANSLVGSSADDEVGDNVTALANGNYVVGTPNWDGAAQNMGAATFGNGTTGITGFISASNSLIGQTANDRVGGAIALTNGDYVVVSTNWDGAAANVGAVTLADGTNGTTGVVSASNSLIGSTADDFIGNRTTALNDGNYLVASPFWDNAAANVGAITFGNGTSGITGVVSPSNSLIGSTADDQIGNGGITALANGNYVIRSSNWDNSGVVNAGAVTFGSGAITGVVSPSNSLVGLTASDQIGSGGITELTNGNYVVSSPNFDNGAFINAGAISFANGSVGIFGPINTNNSVLGTTANGGSSMNFAFDAANNQLVVGRPFDNIVTLFKLAPTASSVSVSGKVQTSFGKGISRALVSITTSNGEIRTMRTNQFGYYRFDDVEVGETYIFNVRSKKYNFAAQVLSIIEDMQNLNFTAQ